MIDLPLAQMSFYSDTFNYKQADAPEEFYLKPIHNYITGQADLAYRDRPITFEQLCRMSVTNNRRINIDRYHQLKRHFISIRQKAIRKEYYELCANLHSVITTMDSATNN